MKVPSTPSKLKEWVPTTPLLLLLDPFTISSFSNLSVLYYLFRFFVTKVRFVHFISPTKMMMMVMAILGLDLAA